MVGVLSLVIFGLLVVAAPSSLAGFAWAEPLASWERHARAALANGECLTAQSLVAQAIEADDPIGFVVRGEMYETGRCAPRRAAQAARHYGAAARRDHVVGHARLAYLVLNGVGVPKDRAWAELLFR